MGFTVVMGGYLIVSAAGDEIGASVLRWLGVACLLLLVLDVLALLTVLGARAITEQDEE